MTAWTTSMSLPSSGRVTPSAGEILHVQPDLSAADVEARRLAAGVARGDEAAFQELYDRYHQRLFRFALVLGHGDEALADETVQSVFVTAAGKLRRVDSEQHLWNWLARVARQHLAKTFRARGSDPTVVSVTELADYADPRQLDSLLEEKLEAALGAMEPEERQLIEWFYFDHWSHKEIAAQLGATPKAVSSRLERARARLRSQLSTLLSHET